MLNEYDRLMNAAQSRMPLYEAKDHQVTLAIRSPIIRYIPKLRNHDAFFFYSHALIVRFAVFPLLPVSSRQVSCAPPLPRIVSTLYTGTRFNQLYLVSVKNSA